jgi:hypothetical protein
VISHADPGSLSRWRFQGNGADDPRCAATAMPPADARPAREAADG